MAAYSGTLLPQKLGIKPGLSVITINAPTNYRRLLGTIPKGVNFFPSPEAGVEFCPYFHQKAQRIGEKIVHLARENRGYWNGLGFLTKENLWRLYRCDRRVVRAVALPLGFVDVKVCAIDETWSGLKLMVRRENRK
jgi:hypothetical protein